MAQWHTQVERPPWGYLAAKPSIWHGPHETHVRGSKDPAPVDQGCPAPAWGWHGTWAGSNPYH
eukprot:742839-Karenia_brevis.AAC.1